MITHDPMKILATFDSFEGMMGRLSAAAFIYFLERQTREDIEGNLIEFGVFKGKSASVLANFTRKSEKLILVDVARHMEANRILDLTENALFVTCRSEDFQKSFSDFKSLKGRSRVVHIDGSHQFDNVVNDLKLADELLGPDGIAILDDFQNPNYPQVQAATFWLLYNIETDLRLFLVGSNKAFLCRNWNHTTYLKLIVRDFADRLEAMGFPVVLSKTDRNEMFDVFVFRGRRKDEESRFYGWKLYKQYYQPRDRYERKDSS